MSSYNKRKIYLQQSIIEYHDFEGVSERIEKEIYIGCATIIAKTLRSMSDLDQIKDEYYSITRIIKLAEWLLKHIKDEKQKVAKLFLRNIKEKQENENEKLKKLQYLYDLASLHPKLNEEDIFKLNVPINFENKKENMTLAEYVFRYFRYEKQNPIALLDSKAFQFKELLLDNSFVIIPSNKTTLITAYCQSGKTFLVIPVVLIYLALGLTPVMVVLDKSQVRQLMRRLRSYCNELKNYLKSLDCFSEDELSIFNDNFIYYDSRIKKSDDDDSLGLALTGERPRIIIAIKHHQHIERINEMVNEFSNIVLIADEAQVSCCYKNIDTDTYHDPAVKYDNEFVKLRESSRKYIAVSATVQDVIMVDKSLYSDNIVYIPPNDYYTGMTKWQFKHINNDEENAVVRILDELSVEKPIVRYDRRHNVENEHPIFVLIKTERKKEDHLLLMNSFMNNELSPVITDADWCVVVEHGECFYLYHSSIMDEPIIIEEQKSTLKKIKDDDDNSITHYFSSNRIDISDVFQYFANEGVKKFPKIALISYDMCKEAISFTSHYDKPHNYHLTHGIFQLGAKTTVSMAMQTMNRLSGNHGDNIRPIIYTLEKTKKDVLNGFAIHDEQVKELISISQKGNVCVSSEYLETYPIFKNRHSVNYNKVKGIEKNLIENPNKSDEDEILEKPNLDCINFLCKIDTEYEKEKRKNIELYGEEYYAVEENEKENDGKYYILDSDNVRRNTLQYKIIEESYKQLIDHNCNGKNVLRTQLIEWLLMTEELKNLTDQSIKGSFDAGIKTHMIKCDDINRNGLLYWNEKNRVYLRLNL
jgi:hypothetical protein